MPELDGGSLRPHETRRMIQRRIKRVTPAEGVPGTERKKKSVGNTRQVERVSWEGATRWFPLQILTISVTWIRIEKPTYVSRH